MKYPQTFENLINGLKKLPGVGAKSAERMAYQILNMDDEDIQNLADVLSTVDVLSDFAEVAVTNGYVRPMFNEDDTVSLTDVRHPVLEQLVGKEHFVKNNIYNFLHISKCKIWILCCNFFN